MAENENNPPIDDRVCRNRYVRKYYRRVNERLRARGTSPAIFQFILIGIIYQRLQHRCCYLTRAPSSPVATLMKILDGHMTISTPKFQFQKKKERKRTQNTFPFSHFHRDPHSRVISLLSKSVTRRHETWSSSLYSSDKKKPNLRRKGKVSQRKAACKRGEHGTLSPGIPTPRVLSSPTRRIPVRRPRHAVIPPRERVRPRSTAPI